MLPSFFYLSCPHTSLLWLGNDADCHGREFHNQNNNKKNISNTNVLSNQ